MTPEQLPVGVFIQFCNPDTILISGDVLCNNVHGNLRQVQVCSDARRSRDTGLEQDLPDHSDRQLMSGHVIGVQIGGDIQKALVNAVHNDVIGAYIFHVDGNNLCADLLVQLHPGWSDIIRQFQGKVSFQRRCVERGTAEMILVVLGGFLHAAEPDRIPQPFLINLLDSLNNLK